jgi:hypothetical protein
MWYREKSECVSWMLAHNTNWGIGGITTDGCIRTTDESFVLCPSSFVFLSDICFYYPPCLSYLSIFFIIPLVMSSALLDIRYADQSTYYIRFDVSTAVTMQNVVFWNKKPSSYLTGNTLVLRYRVQPVNAL